MAHWEWKSDLEAADSVAAAWTRYNAADCTKLEKATKEKQETVHLNDKYAVSLKDSFQFSIADPSRQRAVRRVTLKRAASAGAVAGGPAKKAAGGSAGGRPDFSQKDPSKTDLKMEAKRRSAMPRPTGPELVFFWYGEHLRKKSSPVRAEVASKEKTPDFDASYTSILATCQRTDSDAYEFEVNAKSFDLGFVRAKDFGDWKSFPWITVGPILMHMRNNSAINPSYPLKGTTHRFVLQIEPTKIKMTMKGKDYEFTLKKKLPDDAVLSFWLYQRGDTAEIVV